MAHSRFQTFHPWRWGASWWERATTPLDSVVQEADRRAARLLASLLIVLLILTVTIGIGSTLALQGWGALQTLDFWVTVVMGGLLTVGWAFSRTVHFRIVAIGMIAVINFAVLGLAIPDDQLSDLNLQVYLIVPVLLCSVWFSWRVTLSLAAVDALILLMFPLVFEGVLLRHVWVGFLLSVSGVIVLAMRNATAIERAQQAELIEARERYRSLVEKAPVAIAVHVEGKLVYVNSAAVRLMGAQEPGDLLGKPVLDMLEPSFREVVEQRIVQTQQMQQTAPVLEEKFVRLDGEIIDVEVTAIPFTYDGHPATQVVVQDITARKQAVDALRRSETQNRALLNAIPDLIFRFDAEGRFITYHDSGSALNLPSEIFLGRTLSELLPPLGESAMGAIRQTLATGEIQTFEYPFVLEGVARDFEARLVASGDDEVVAIVRDVTERKRSEDALRESEARNRALLAVIPDLMIRFNRRGQVLSVHAEGKEQFLVGPVDEMPGRNLEDGLPEDYARRLRATVERALDTGEMQRIEYHLNTGDHPRDFEGRVMVSGPDEVLYIVRDITERKAAENALLVSEAQNRALLAAIPDLMLHIEHSGKILAVHAAGHEALLLAPPEQLIGQGIETFLSEKALTETRQYIERALAGEMPVWEYELALPVGRHMFEARMVASNKTSVLAIIRDITESRRMDAALRRRDEILEALTTASGWLLKARNFDAVVNDVLAKLGQAAHMSRAYIFANQTPADGPVYTQLEYLWAEPEFDVPRDTLQHVPLYVGPVSLGDQMSQGEAIHGIVRELQGSARPLLEAHGVLSVVLVPIFVEDEWWGFLGFDDCEQERTWLTVEVEALRSAANALGAAILRRRIETAEREARRMSESLREVATALTSSLDPAVVMERLLEMLERVVGHDAANIMQIDQMTQSVHVVSFRGYTQRGTDDYMRRVVIPLDDPTYQFLDRLRRTEPLILADIHQADWWDPMPETQWIRSFASVPIRYQGEVIGLLNLDSATPGFFTVAHASYLKAFAEQAAIALRNAQIFTAEREHRALSEALRETLAGINRTLDPDVVLDLILTNIEGVLPHNAANFMLVENGTLRVAHARGYEAYDCAEWLQSLRVDFRSWPLAEKMLTSGQPVILNDTYTDPSWKQYPETEWIRSAMGMALRVEERMIGLMLLDSAQPHVFRPEHGELLHMFAEQAAVALNNAHLYDEMRRYADELAVLYRGTTFLFSALPMVNTVTDLSEQIVESVVQTFKRVDCGLILLDEVTGQLQTVARAGDYRIGSAQMLALSGPGLVASALRSGEVIYVPNVAADERYLEGDPRTVSELVIPLKTSSGAPLGALDLQSIENDAFTVHDNHVLTVFAERVAAALENRQLYAQIRKHADELELRVVERTIDLSVRNAVAETLSSSLDTTEMLTGVLQTIVEQLKVMGGAIYLLDSDSLTLDLVVVHGLSEQTLRAVTGIVPGSSDLGLLQDAIRAPGTYLSRLTEEAQTSAVLNIPIWRQEQVQGVITLIHDQPRAWGEEETRMIDAIGRQIGVALSNARLFTEAVHGEARLRAIVESAADGVLMFDQAQELMLINPASEALFRFYPEFKGGATRAASLLWNWLQGRAVELNAPEAIEFSLPVESLVHESRPRLAQCSGESCPFGGRADQHWPCWLIDPAQNAEEFAQCPLYQSLARRAMQARSAPVQAENGTVMGTVIVLHDVTYYRELDNLKGRFVSTVSHELRTPLSSIMLDISSLAKYYHRFGDAERLRIVGQVRDQANVLKDLIEDILELSRFDARRAMPQKQWFDLAAHSRDLIDTMRTMTREKDLLVDTTDLVGVHYVNADPSQIMRALRNLFSNAVKYTPDGGRISVGLTRITDAIRLWVSDTGIGIPADEQSYVFDPFYRSEAALNVASGTGLGLAITHEIVELHAGSIELDSAPGRGSTFTITLPVPVESGRIIEL